MLRKGVLPRVSFPLLAELSKDRQKRSTTARGNRIGPPNDVAFMQRRQLVDFVEKKLRCERHSKRLRFCATKSHQVGVCASWCFVCEQGCLLDLRQAQREAEAAEAAEVAAAGDEDLVEEESPADSLDGSDEDEDMD